MKNFFLLILFALFFSCNDEKEHLPDDILPSSKMISVLADVHLAEAALTSKTMHPDSLSRLAVEYYENIYKIHRTSKDEYERSLEYYKAHPEKFEEIYTEVINLLSQKQSDITTE